MVPSSGQTKNLFFCLAAQLKTVSIGNVLAFLPLFDESYIFDYWPEARNLDSEDAEGYSFTDRFRKPEWWYD